MMGASKHFTVLQAKSLYVKSAALCPSMDLIAIITADGNIILHRIFAWDVVRRLSSVELLGIIPSSISFAPTGKLISIGGQNGEILILDIESGLVMKAMQSTIIRNIATSIVLSVVWNQNFPISLRYDSCSLKWQVWRYGGLDLVQRFGLPNFNEGLEDLSLASPSTDSSMLTAIVNGASGSLLLALHADNIVIAYVLGIFPLFWLNLNGSNSSLTARHPYHQDCWMPVSGTITDGIIFIKPSKTTSSSISHQVPTGPGFSLLFIPVVSNTIITSISNEKDTTMTTVGNSNLNATSTTTSNTSSSRVKTPTTNQKDISNAKILTDNSFGILQWGMALTWREKYATLYIRIIEDSKLCEEMLLTCVKKWKDVNKVLGAKVSLLKELITSYELPFTPIEFYHTIAHCGLWHPAAQTCILQHWNEQGLQRFKMAVDTVFKYFTETFSVRMTSLIVNIHLRCREMLGIDSILFDGNIDICHNVKKTLCQLSYLSEQLIIKVEEVVCHSRLANYNLLLFAQFIRDFLQSEASDNNTNSNDTNNGNNNIPYCIDATRSSYVKLFDPRLRRLLQNNNQSQNNNSSMECISNTFLTAHFTEDTVPLDWTEYTLLRNNKHKNPSSMRSLPLGKVGPLRGEEDAETVFTIVEAIETSRLRQYFPENDDNNNSQDTSIRQKELLQTEGRKSLKGVFKEFQNVFQNLLEINDAALSAHMSSLVLPTHSGTLPETTPPTATTSSISKVNVSTSIPATANILSWQASSVTSLSIRIQRKENNGTITEDENMVIIDSPLVLVYAEGREGDNREHNSSSSSDIYCIIQSQSPLPSPLAPQLHVNNSQSTTTTTTTSSNICYVTKIAMRSLLQSPSSRDSQDIERVHHLRIYIATVGDERRQSIVGIVSVTKPDNTALVLLVKFDISDLVFEKYFNNRDGSSSSSSILESYSPVLLGATVPHKSRVLDFDISVVEDLVLVECASRGVVAISDSRGKLIILDLEDHEEEEEESVEEDDDGDDDDDDDDDDDGL